MSMLGAPDQLYAKAREILLDALEALGEQRAALVLVGAQAIYLHTGEADIAVAPFTTDADLVLEPERLADRPLIGAALEQSGFVAGVQPGEWLKDEVRVDLMVPAALAGPGRRGVRLGVHGNRAARKARGLEGALVDRDRRVIESFASSRRGVVGRSPMIGTGAIRRSTFSRVLSAIDGRSRTPRTFRRSRRRSGGERRFSSGGDSPRTSRNGSDHLR
jgi:hypothetical protein